MDEFEDCQIDDILANLESKKKRKKNKINSGDKGDRTERGLCKLLSERFGVPFDRTSGSGARRHQIRGLTESAKNVLVGDIAGPDDFAWVIECKGGYEDKVDFHSIFASGNRTIDTFIEQVLGDAGASGKKPMVCYKRNLRAWIAFVPTALLPDVQFEYRMSYRDWTAVSLEKLLGTDDSYFFRSKETK